MILEAILLTWGTMYLVTAAVKPDIIKNMSGFTSMALMLVMGVSTLISVAVNLWWLFGILGGIEALGAVRSYTGLTIWNVEGNQTVVRTAMSFMDFIAAVSFFGLMLGGVVI